MRDKLATLDLFAGIGGIALGLEQTGGFEAAAFCEVEKGPRANLAKNWPGVFCYGDVRDLTGKQLAADGISIDLICGGFPCQDISYAGFGEGLAGERSGLWSHFARLVGEIRPKYVLVENVAALLARGLGRVLGDLAEIGYDAEWHCIPASHLGFPHIRDRVWIIAYPRKEREQGSEHQALSRLYGIPWRENVREAQKWAKRSMLSKSSLCRGSDGVSGRMDRVARLGNAVVPAVVELLGYCILEHYKERENGLV